MFSGATGVQVRRFDAFQPVSHFGMAVAGRGDGDGDGIPDVLIGAPFEHSCSGVYQPGTAYLFSGRSGELLRRWEGVSSRESFGHSVSWTGDLDGDGCDDVLIGAPYANPNGVVWAGSAYVYSSRSRQLLYRFDGEPDSFFGSSVAGIGDADADGFPDLLVGASQTRVAGMNLAGSAYLYSGATGRLVHRVDGTNTDHRLGFPVADAGDVDQDGAADLLIGAIGMAPGGLYRAGSALVYSGADGSLLFQFDGQEANAHFGSSVAVVGDLDGDGVGDFAIGAIYEHSRGLQDSGAVHLFSGADRRPIGRLVGTERFAYFGSSVRPVGDLDGDGLVEIVVGAHGTNANGVRDAGSAFVVRLAPFLSLSRPELSASGGPPLILDIEFPTSEARLAYAVLASGTGRGPTHLRGVRVPLAPDPLYRRLLAGWEPRILSGGFGWLDAGGDAQAILRSGPILAPFVGRTGWIAAISWNPANQVVRLSSIARPLTIVP